MWRAGEGGLIPHGRRLLCLSVSSVPPPPTSVETPWFRDRSVLRQLPVLHRAYALHSRFVERTGVDRGRNFLFRLINRVYRLLGRDPTIQLRLGSLPLFVDLRDRQMLMSIDHLRVDSGDQRVLRDLLADGDTFVDIGANYGTYAVIASAFVGEKGVIVAFEPQRRLADLTRRSLDVAHRGDHEVHAVACSDARGYLEFYIPSITEHGSGWAGVYPAHSAKSKHSIVHVQAVTVDSVLAARRLPGRLLIKIDVEGAELRTIRGARETIRQYKPFILFELNPLTMSAAGWRPEEIFALLSELGYRSIAECERYPETMPIDAAAGVLERSKSDDLRNLLAVPA